MNLNFGDAHSLNPGAGVMDTTKTLQVNLSQVCNKPLREVVRHEQECRWREEHADFIAVYNATIETEGLPLDAWRTF